MGKRKAQSDERIDTSIVRATAHISKQLKNGRGGGFGRQAVTRATSTPGLAYLQRSDPVQPAPRKWLGPQSKRSAPRDGERRHTSGHWYLPRCAQGAVSPPGLHPPRGHSSLHAATLVQSVRYWSARPHCCTSQRRPTGASFDGTGTLEKRRSATS